MPSLKLSGACIGSDKIKCRVYPPNLNQPMHWAVRRKWKEAFEQMIWGLFVASRKEYGKLPWKGAKIEFNFNLCRELDYDNAWTSIKPLLDGIKKCEIIEDDSPKFVELSLKQNKVNHKNDQCIIINLEPKT